MRIGTREVGPGRPCFVVAEIGMNHDGRLDKAKALIEAAAAAGVDAVKFQTFRATDIVNPALPADYDPQEPVPARFKFFHEYIAQFELRYEWHDELIAFARERGLVFLSTPCSAEAVEFLASRVPALKVASMDLTNIPLLRDIGRRGKPVIVSTGIGTLAEIDEALRTLRAAGASEPALLHCVSNYPARPELLNLRNIPMLREAFEVPVGFSDHSLGMASAVAAVAIGACIVEKHITLDRKTPGPDHYFALEPQGFRDLVAGIREAEAALGSPARTMDESERVKKTTYRRSLVARRDLPPGHRLGSEDLAVIRPGSGIPPSALEDVLGMALHKAVRAHEPLTWGHLKP